MPESELRSSLFSRPARTLVSPLRKRNVVVTKRLPKMGCSPPETTEVISSSKTSVTSPL